MRIITILATGLAVALGAWLVLRPAILERGPPPMTWVACQPEQKQIMVLGTFHFSGQEKLDLSTPTRRQELNELVDGLAKFQPDRVLVEYAWSENEELQGRYDAYLERPQDSTGWKNEIAHIGFRLARRLGHEGVVGVDVPMYLWDDSIAVFDERYPRARSSLRRAWNIRYPSGPTQEPLPNDATITELIARWNTDAPPSIPEYGRFLPLVEDDIYAGALKLRPWYDRNLRIVQNIFRALGPEGQRGLLIIGGSHVRVLRQLLDLTPQFCAVDARPFLGSGASHTGRTS